MRLHVGHLLIFYPLHGGLASKMRRCQNVDARKA